MLRLLQLNPKSPSDEPVIELIERDTAVVGFYEAFLAAGPQFILQATVILRLGYFSKAGLRFCNGRTCF